MPWPKLSHAQPTPSCFGLQRMQELPTCWDICCGPFGCHKTTVATTQLGPAISPRPGARHQQRLRLAAANARRFADVARCCRLLRRPLRLHRTWLAPSHPGSSSKRQTYPIMATPKACSTRSPCSLDKICTQGIVLPHASYSCRATSRGTLLASLSTLTAVPFSLGCDKLLLCVGHIMTRFASFFHVCHAINSGHGQ